MKTFNRYFIDAMVLFTTIGMFTAFAYADKQMQLFTTTWQFIFIAALYIRDEIRSLK